MIQIRRDDDVVSGTVVEDYSDQFVSGTAVGRDWAQPHRWAAASDSGVLVFVDDGDLLDKADDDWAEHWRPNDCLIRTVAFAVL
ncbi:hypothetical protein [Rhodococcoides fascians]|uniref:hypothetical protein n=1 Tax=Rhodococcoides fascians TaxID=1828 RepID=UPI00211B2D86|nr:hypothetical protein [Rhodococcus fascians]